MNEIASQEMGLVPAGKFKLDKEKIQSVFVYVLDMPLPGIDDPVLEKILYEFFDTVKTEIKRIQKEIGIEV